MIGATTGVLTLKNGVETPTEVVEVLGPEHVMVGVTPVRSVLAAPGRLRHLGGVDPNLTLGEIGNHSSARVKHIRTALAKVQVTVHVPEDIHAWLWWKFVGAATLGGLGLEYWSGAVVRLGREAGGATPLNEFIYYSLLPQERQARGQV